MGTLGQGKRGEVGKGCKLLAIIRISSENLIGNMTPVINILFYKYKLLKE